MSENQNENIDTVNSNQEFEKTVQDALKRFQRIIQQRLKRIQPTNTNNTED